MDWAKTAWEKPVGRADLFIIMELKMRPHCGQARWEKTDVLSRQVATVCIFKVYFWPRDSH
jgi:hypothetical protein